MAAWRLSLEADIIVTTPMEHLTAVPTAAEEEMAEAISRVFRQTKCYTPLPRRGI